MTLDNNVKFDKEGLAISEGLLTVYNFDSETGLYIGSSQEFLAQGLGIPAHSTVDVPPNEIAGKVNVFRNGEWQQVADHRGETVYSTVTGESITITLPGDYPAGTTLLEPTTAFDKWNGTTWETDIVAAQQAEISKAEATKSAFLNEALATCQVWQTQLMLGIITEDDKALLTQWMKYYQQVQAVDTTKAPDISWPQKPV